MVKVITYGSYDLLHHGHIRLLERAKALGDYLIVGVTSDDFDKTRGKINLQQSLMERVEAVKATGLADEIIIEEFEGQKIDDIKKYDVDIFTVGSDWEGKFDYLNEYCKVIYLPRTEGISSSDIREKKRNEAIGIIADGQPVMTAKFINECGYVNGARISGVYSKQGIPGIDEKLYVDSEEQLFNESDAIYIDSFPENHYSDTKKALLAGKHVICEAPLSLNKKECEELFRIADENNLILMTGIKTAYADAYYRLNLLIKSGIIGDVFSISSTCTSLLDEETIKSGKVWNGICEWGPIALLPILQIMGTDYIRCNISTRRLLFPDKFDTFTQFNFGYDVGIANVMVGNQIKSEGELIVSGSKGYVHVPAPWWKMDYFEVRFENPLENKRYFYQLEGEGIRYQIVAFLKAIQTGKLQDTYISRKDTLSICSIMEQYYSDDVRILR